MQKLRSEPEKRALVAQTIAWCSTTTCTLPMALSNAERNPTMRKRMTITMKWKSVFSLSESRINSGYDEQQEWKGRSKEASLRHESWFGDYIRRRRVRVLYRLRKVPLKPYLKFVTWYGVCVAVCLDALFFHMILYTRRSSIIEKYWCST